VPDQAVQEPDLLNNSLYESAPLVDQAGRFLFPVPEGLFLRGNAVTKRDEEFGGGAE
jgi:hypothetical protein